jgi:hypothetical protein
VAARLFAATPVELKHGYSNVNEPGCETKLGLEWIEDAVKTKKKYNINHPVE